MPPARVILLAAGRGSRMAGTVADKVLAPLAGVPVFLRSWRAFAQSGEFSGVTVVYRDEAQRQALAALLAAENDVPALGELHWVRGGEERADSVRAGLAALPADDSLVAIHDAARPFIRSQTILDALETAALHGAAVVARPVVDTIKRIPANSAPHAPVFLEDLDRSCLWAMETPQVARHDWLTAGYASVTGPLTDDSAALAVLGHRVAIVPNPFPNPKITRPEDLAWAEFLLDAGPS